MNYFKVDEEKLKAAIDVFAATGKHPYIVCNENTARILSEQNNEIKIISKIKAVDGTIYHVQKPIDKISINNETYVKEGMEKPKFADYYETKIMIDDDLKDGDIKVCYYLE